MLKARRAREVGDENDPTPPTPNREGKEGKRRWSEEGQGILRPTRSSASGWESPLSNRPVRGSHQAGKG
eukprot:2683131-Prorocentrum_lima.AAC.1